MGFTPLFEAKDSIHSFMDVVGADLDVKPRTKKIVLPDTSVVNYLYGYVFQSHNGNDFEPNRMLFVLENGKGWWNKPNTRIWIDKDHDFQFDDEKADTLRWGKSDLIFYSDSISYSSGFLLRLFPSNKFYRFSKMNDLSIKELKGPRDFVGTKYSMKEIRYNVRYDLVRFRSDTLMVGLMDMNLNGSFTDPGIDQWVISVFNAAGEFENPMVTPYAQDASLAWLGYQFKLSSSLFPAFEFELDPVTCAENTLVKGEKIPRFRYCLAQKKSRKRRSRQKWDAPHIYVVWAAENSTFISDSALLHRLIRQRKDIHWVFLNFGGSGRYVAGYNRRFDIEIEQGFCNSKISEKLKLQSLPQYFYWHENHRLISTFKRIKDLEGMLISVDKSR